MGRRSLVGRLHQVKVYRGEATIVIKTDEIDGVGGLIASCDTEYADDVYLVYGSPDTATQEVKQKLGEYIDNDSVYVKDMNMGDETIYIIGNKPIKIINE